MSGPNRVVVGPLTIDLPHVPPTPRTGTHDDGTAYTDYVWIDGLRSITVHVIVGDVERVRPPLGDSWVDHQVAGATSAARAATVLRHDDSDVHDETAELLWIEIGDVVASVTVIADEADLRDRVLGSVEVLGQSP